MKKIILLSIILIFLTTGIGFAFQNEPDGFRGLKWGDAPTEDMYFSSQAISKYDIHKGNYYYRKSDKLKIGSAELVSIKYLFNLYSNQFYKVWGMFYSETNYDILKIIFEERFGLPTKLKNKKYPLFWNGDKTKIQLFFYPDKNAGIFTIINREIHSEEPEDNKQKEAEKAKEDF